MYIYFPYQHYKEKSFRNHDIKALQQKLKQGENADQFKAILYKDTSSYLIFSENHFTLIEYENILKHTQPKSKCYKYQHNFYNLNIKIYLLS